MQNLDDVEINLSKGHSLQPPPIFQASFRKNSRDHTREYMAPQPVSGRYCAVMVGTQEALADDQDSGP